MDKTYEQIDEILRRTNKIYISYSVVCFSITSYIISLTKYSKVLKLASTVSISLLSSGILTWVHIINAFNGYELAYLRVGLDKSYPSIKSSNNKIG
jgi:hypothetical protein